MDHPESRSDETPVPQGVELLLPTHEIKARIAHIRHVDRSGVTDELRRLVTEESSRELRRLGVIS